MRDKKFMSQATVKFKKTILVARKNKYRLFYAGLIFLLIVLFMAVKLLISDKKESSADEISSALPADWNNTMKIPNFSAVTASPQKEYDNDIKKDKTDLQDEKIILAEKLQQLRDSAPIQMYSAGGGKILNFPVANIAEKQTQPLSFAKKESTNESREAKLLPHPEYTVLQGTLVPGVLHTAINSDLPGMVKAMVSYDVYSATNKNILIPKGSILIGQYNSAVMEGQNRILIMWTRLIRPDHVTINLDSPAADMLGRSGINASSVDNHFWERFSEASLLSIIAAGTSNVGVNDQQNFNSANAYRMGIASGFQQSANDSLKMRMGIKPTLNIDQGKQIYVFINHDLSFYSVMTEHQNHAE